MFNVRPRAFDAFAVSERGRQTPVLQTINESKERERELSLEQTRESVTRCAALCLILRELFSHVSFDSRLMMRFYRFVMDGIRKTEHAHPKSFSVSLPHHVAKAVDNTVLGNLCIPHLKTLSEFSVNWNELLLVESKVR